MRLGNGFSHVSSEKAMNPLKQFIIMHFKHLLLLGALAMASTQAMATIVNGVRQKPVPQTTAFQAGVESYLYNVDAKMFFCAGNSYGTQASVGEQGLLTRFVNNGDGSYFLQDYFRDSWMYTFINSTTVMFVDRASQSDYYWAIENNGTTFRIYPSAKNPNYYHDMFGTIYYMGVDLSENASNTALSPYLKGTEGQCINWALVTAEALADLQVKLAVYEKAQRLKELIDAITAKGGNASELTAIYENEDATMSELSAAIRSAKTLLYGEDVTSYIANAGFDSDLTFQIDGSMKQAVSTSTSLSNRSWAYIAADNTVYARPKSSSSQQRTDGRNKEDAVNGFHGQLQGWTLEGVTFPNCEWMYYGTVPYGLPTDAVLIADDGNGTLLVPERCIEFDDDDNNGMLYMRAGWNNSCVYKQEVKLPCAVYHLEYWTINVNPNSTAMATDMTQITCRKEVFKDNTGTGLSSSKWVKHEFEFTPTSKFTIQFGYKSANSSSNINPWVCLDGIKLYKIGEADPIPLLKSDISDYLDELPSLKDSALKYGLQGVVQQIAAVNTSSYWSLVDNSKNLTELQQANDELQAIVEGAKEALEALPQIESLIAQIDALIDGVETSNAQKLKASRDAAYAVVYETGNGKAIAATLQTLQNAIAYYNRGEQLLTKINELESVISQKANAQKLSAVNKAISDARTLYERGEITEGEYNEQIDLMTNAQNAFIASAEKYAQLPSAFEELEGYVAQKANSNVLQTANELLASVKNGYENGTIEDDAIEQLILEMSEAGTKVNASATLYGQLNGAIANLKATIDEVSGETQHVSKTTLQQAQDLYDASVLAYNNGTVADDRIASRINVINETIENLTRSLNLYKSLATAIANLQEAVNVAAGSKMSANVRNSANTLLQEAQTAYSEGNYKDSEIENKVQAINDMMAALTASIAQYTSLQTSISEFQTAMNAIENAHLSATLKTTAKTMLENAKTGYENETLSNQEAAQLIANMSETKTLLNASVEAYQTLATAIEELEPVVTKKANKDALTSANALLTSAKAGYENGSIADEDIATLVQNMSDAANAVNASAEIYATLATALAELNASIAEASAESARVSQNTLTQAKDLYDASLAAYNDGTIADNRIAARITVIEQTIGNLMSSINLYKDFAAAIANLKTAIDGMEGKKLATATLTAASELYTTADAAYNEGTIDDEQVAAQVTALNSMITTLNNSVAAYTNLKTAIDALDAAKTMKAAQAVLDEAAALVAATTTAYNEGSITDAAVSAKITELENKLADVNASVEIYATYAAAIANLKTALEGTNNKKLSAATRSAAQTLTNTLDAAYAAGTMTDQQAEEAAAMITTLESSVAVYATLKTALDDLQTKITEAENSNKVMADLLTEAQTLLESESKKYNDGSLTDNDVPASVEAIRNMISKLQEAIDSTPTRINAVSTATDADNTYTMGGRKVVGKQKGLVIRNGRKVVVK